MQTVFPCYSILRVGPKLHPAWTLTYDGPWRRGSSKGGLARLEGGDTEIPGPVIPAFYSSQMPIHLSGFTSSRKTSGPLPQVGWALCIFPHKTPCMSLIAWSLVCLPY